jgi:hypothetical protein
MYKPRQSAYNYTWKYEDRIQGDKQSMQFRHPRGAGIKYFGEPRNGRLESKKLYVD